MGQDDDYADLIAKDLLDSFDRSLADKRNERGGVYRAVPAPLCTTFSIPINYVPPPTDVTMAR